MTSLFLMADMERSNLMAFVQVTRCLFDFLQYWFDYVFQNCMIKALQKNVHMTVVLVFSFKIVCMFVADKYCIFMKKLVYWFFAVLLPLLQPCHPDN